MEVARQNYRTVKRPASFGGINKFSKHNFIKNVGLRKMRQLLGGINSYTMHREVKRPKVRNPYFIYHKRQQVQADLIDMSAYAKSNSNVKYIFTSIDMFSKYAFCYPMKRKTGEESRRALEKMLQFYQTAPQELFTDRGLEFINERVRLFLRDNNIVHRLPHSDLKCAGVERFNKTIQSKIYRYMTENNTRRYIHVLADLVDSYNKTEHRTIKMTPQNAEKDENHLWVLDRLLVFYDRGTKSQKRRKFQVGDVVRIAKTRGAFQRSYQEQSNPTLFQIVGIRTMPIPMYILHAFDEENNVIQGGFYDSELSLVDFDKFVIEKTLRQKNGTYLVKWNHLPARYNSWLPKSVYLAKRNSQSNVH